MAGSVLPLEAGGPAWLCRSAVERHVASMAPEGVYSPGAYRRILGTPLSSSAQGMTDQHGFRRDRVDVRFDDLVRAGPERVQRWMERKAQVADGAGLRRAWLLDPDVLIEAIEEATRSNPDWAMACGRMPSPGGLSFSGASSTWRVAAAWRRPRVVPIAR